MKKTGLIITAALSILTLAGCGTGELANTPGNAPVQSQNQTATQPVQETDEQKAVEVAKNILDASASLTYKDHNSFNAEDKYLLPELAQIERKNRAKVIPKYDANKAYEVHGDITVTSVKNVGKTFVINVKTPVTVYQDPNKKVLARFTQVDSITIVKTSDGQFLASGINAQELDNQ